MRLAVRLHATFKVVLAIGVGDKMDTKKPSKNKLLHTRAWSTLQQAMHSQTREEKIRCSRVTRHWVSAWLFRPEEEYKCVRKFVSSIAMEQFPKTRN
ncbi:hypothetical protein ElyMa_004568100 [Elysia marginata]|uniref:Secreted protein n=1 Tax=Elysia marginata TaxID=1093978 RepID=A0AAV4HUN7_9GAST|nr:hypothetical protein ElyMa_004568100 [Elysia marginata]